MFQRDSFLPFGYVVWFCFAVYGFELAVLWRETGAFHLSRHHVAGERDYADVVPGRCFDRNDVTCFEGQVVDIFIVTAARVLEPHLENVGRCAGGICG